MSNLRFSSQSACDKFYAKLDALKDSYVSGDMAPDETYDALTIDYNYGSKKATELIELWRVKYNADWVKFDPHDSLGIESEMME